MMPFRLIYLPNESILFEVPQAKRRRYTRLASKFITHCVEGADRTHYHAVTAYMTHYHAVTVYMTHYHAVTVYMTHTR